MSEHVPKSMVTEEDRLAAEAPVMVSRWAIHRRMYDWVLGFAHHKHSTTALAVLSFAESSFFPIPPDVLLMPMCLERRNRAFWYATVCSIASVLGGMLGYLIGWWVWTQVSGFFFHYVFSEKDFNTVSAMYHQNEFMAVFAAGFTPLPYKVFTIAAGVCEIGFGMFVVASACSRSARFFLEAALAWKFGPPVRVFIDKYFNWLCIGVTAAGVLGFVAVKYWHCIEQAAISLVR